MDGTVQLVNNALVMLGEGPITDLTDDTDKARVMNGLYVPTLDAKLLDGDWNFANTRAALTPLTATPLWGWSFMHALPSDPYCLRVLATDIDADLGLTLSNDPDPDDTVQPGGEGRWAIETYISGTVAAGTYSAQRVLVANDSPVSILYLARITDVTLWSTYFAYAMQVELAYLACYAITRNAQLKGELDTERTRAWAKARSRDGQEGRKLKKMLSDSLIRVR